MKKYWKHSCISVALAVIWTLLSPLASEAATSHRSPLMVDVDTPQYVGYDSSLRAYHFRVTGRWLAACGGRFCWYASPTGYDIGTNDSVGIRFSSAVEFKRFQIRAYDACGRKTYEKARTADFGDFQEAQAGLNDAGFTSWRKTTNWQTGDVLEDSGSCRLSTLPTTNYGAGYYTYKGWTNLKAQHFIYDVWVNPAGSYGPCYQNVYVKAAYTHTWSTSGISWGFGYPWGVGAGLTEGSSKFFVWQNQDGEWDPALTTGRLCRH